MENYEKWYEIACQNVPQELKKYIEIVLSPNTEYYYMLFRGVGYKNIPKRPYEFVFIDGPSTTAPSDGHKTFNFDFIHVVSDSERPVFGILDLRLSTHYVLREIFGSEKVRFNPYRSLGFIGPCSKKDLHTTAEIINRHADDF